MTRSLWLFPWLLVSIICFFKDAECRTYEKCPARDGRQGVCVLRRYCREANTNPSKQYPSCAYSGNLICCPIAGSASSSTPPSLIAQSSSRHPQYGDPPGRSVIGVQPPSSGDSSTNHRPPSRRPQYDDLSPVDSSDSHRPSDRQPNRQPTGSFGVQNPNPVRATERDEVLTSNTRPTRRPESDYRDDLRPNPSRTTSRRPNRQEPIRPSRNGNHKDTRIAPTYQSEVYAPIIFPATYETSVIHPIAPACGDKPYELFIAGGEEAQEHEWPWMAAVFRRHQNSRPNTFLCGGSLINSKYILSAAHCFVHNYVILPASSFVIRLGSHYLNSGEDYTVANLVIHHNHSGSDFFNDIALVRLASEVYFTDKIAPICLPSAAMATENLVGRIATVAGWGDTTFRGSGARNLQHVTLPIVSSEECSSAYSRVRGAAFLARGSSHVICAGLIQGGKDACLGDSGGPLMLKSKGDRWTVVGIVSLGYKCAEPGFPGVYTRVTHYLDWIDTNMKRP